MTAVACDHRGCSFSIRVAVLLLLGLAGCHAPNPQYDASDGPTLASLTEGGTPVSWPDLIPPGSIASIRPPQFQIHRSYNNSFGQESGDGGPEGLDHSSTQRAEQFGSFETVSSLDGRHVALTGYVVSLETDAYGRMTDFLFVPFFGACIHVPPPPPNQVIHVHLQHAIEPPEPWDPYVLRGILQANTYDADVASAAYTVIGGELEARTQR